MLWKETLLTRQHVDKSPHEENKAAEKIGDLKAYKDWNSGSAGWHRSLVGRSLARQAEDLGSYPSECQIINLFRCVLSSLLPLRSVRRSNFDKGLHNLIKLIKKRYKIIIKMKLLYYKMESTVDSYEKKHYVYIYIYIFFIKSLELKCHAHIFWLFVLLCSNTRDAYLFVAIHFMYMYTYI